MTDEVEPPFPADEDDEQPKPARRRPRRNVSPLTTIIAERLRTARLARAMTQQEVAGTDYSTGYISAIECGRMTPSISTLALLAQRLAVSLTYLLGEGQEELVLPQPARHTPGLPGVSSPGDREAIQQRLNQAKTSLRGGNWREAWRVLGEGERPLGNVFEIQLVDWYWLTGWALIQQQQPDDAARLLQEGVKLAKQLRVLLPSSLQAQLEEAIVWVTQYLGTAYCALGKTPLAYQYHLRCRNAILDGTVRDPELKLVIYTGLGRDALVLGRFEESISAYQNALRQAEDQRNPRQRGFAYWGLGMAYQAKEDFLRAKASYRQALEELNQHEDLRLLAQVRNLLGHVLFHLGAWKQAERQYRFSLKVVQRLEDYTTWGYLLGNLSELFAAQGQWEEALAAAKAGVLIAQKSGDARNHGQLYLLLATASAATDDLVGAEQALKKAMAIFEEVGDYSSLGDARTRYAECLNQQGCFEAAYEQMRLELASLPGR